MEGVQTAAGKKPTMAVFWVVMGLAGLLLLAFLFKARDQAGELRGLVAPAGVADPGSRGNLPEFSLERITGGEGMPVTPEQLRGRPAVIHFWATWCPPCRAEFPQFARYADGAAGRGDVAVLAVSLDEKPDPVEPFVVRAGVPMLPVYWDAGRLAGALHVTAIPTTLIVDKAGRIAFRAEGVQDWTESGVPKRVAEVAGE